MSTVSEAVKKSTKKQTEFLPKLLNVSTIPSLRTDEIFTNLLIQHGRKPVGKVEYTGRRDRLVDYSRVSGTQVKESQEIFFRTIDNESNPKRILLTGKAGIGKSLFCRKLLRDWANDELFKPGPRNREFPDFAFAYLLTFRQLSLLGEQNVSLQDILNCCTLLDDQCRIDDLLLQYLVNHPEEVLIIIDGFDEYFLQDYIVGNTHERYPNSCQEKMPVAALCAKLINGQILGQSTVLITSRPDESDKLCEVRFHRNVEITGFSEQEVTEYIKSYFRENESMKHIVLEHITKNEDLLSFAHVPVLCALMCLHFEWVLKASGSYEDLPVKVSELYSEVLSVFERNHIKKKQTFLGESTLDKLSDFAAQSLLSRRFEFTEEEMKRLNLEEVDVEALRRGGLLHCGPPFMISISQTTKYFCFTHLTVHEYLAARSFVKGREIPEGVSTMVLQFIAGILSKTKDSNLMEELLKKLPITEKELLLQAKCLCEYNDKEFARNHFRHLCIANKDYGKYVQFKGINDVDCIAVEFLLDVFSSMNEVDITSSNQSLSELIIQHSFLTPSGVKRICRALQSNFCAVNGLTLLLCGLIAKCVQPHIRMLVSTKLLYLNLRGNLLTDVGVAILSEAIKQSSCQLTTLDLGCNQISDYGVASLSEGLKQSTCQLTTLDLDGNQISDYGVASLSEGLKQSTCQLTTLDLGGNQISDYGVASLSEGLKQSTCQLTTLYLSDNRISDAGVASLSEALKQSSCQLTTLKLAGTKITDDGVASLSEALKQSSCRLITLDLGGNQISDAGVASLSEAIKQSSCQLTTLKLAGTKITDDGVASLSEALKQSSCRLTTLGLGYNRITDAGVASLSEAIKQSSFQLTTLDLGGNLLTDVGVASLSEALKQSSCQLTTLVLGYNRIADAGVASLSEAIKQSSCRVTTLGLGYNRITDAGVASLSEAIKQSSFQLTTLDLGGNRITDTGVASLSEALKQSSCQLTTRDLRHNQISHDGVTSEALKH